MGKKLCGLKLSKTRSDIKLSTLLDELIRFDKSNSVCGISPNARAPGAELVCLSSTFWTLVYFINE